MFGHLPTSEEKVNFNCKRNAVDSFIEVDEVSKGMFRKDKKELTNLTIVSFQT